MPPASSMPKLDSVPLSGQMKIFAGMPLEFFPGEGYRYSNIGINIIGRVIEAASGIPYAEFVKERILDPLEMRDTSFFPSPEQAARIASPYAAGASGNGFKKVSIPFFTYPLNSPGREPVSRRRAFLHGGRRLEVLRDARGRRSLRRKADIVGGGRGADAQKADSRGGQ